MYRIEEVEEKFTGDWTYDAGINLLYKPEITNEDAINQSIEMILATPIGTRLFNLNFGSSFSLLIFSNYTEAHIRSVMDETLDAIDRWEDRITLIRNEVEVKFNTSNHTLELTIPYIINSVRVKGTFYKIIKE